MRITYTTPPASYPAIYDKLSNGGHVLIAGATGSGKSVTIDGILYRLAINAPAENTYSIIDLKRVSLRQWQKLPHCISYADTVSTAESSITSAVRLMEQRYNELLKDGKTHYSGKAHYLVIDESADLLSSISKAAIADLVKIGRLGRAARVFLIYATQAPDKKTIPASIQQNVTCALALRCKDAIASRQVTGFAGAEKLPMYGNGYLLTPAVREPELVKLPMVAQDEIDRIIKWWTVEKKQHIKRKLF